MPFLDPSFSHVFILRIPVFWTYSCLFHIENTNAWTQVALKLWSRLPFTTKLFERLVYLHYTLSSPVLIPLPYTFFRPLSVLKVNNDLCIAKSTGHFPLLKFSSQCPTRCTICPIFSWTFWAVSLMLLFFSGLLMNRCFLIHWNCILLWSCLLWIRVTEKLCHNC